MNDTPLKPASERMTVDMGLAEDTRKRLTNGLALILANSYVLLGKTLGFH